MGVRRMITFAKAYGIKVRCYVEHVGETPLEPRKNEGKKKGEKARE